MALSENLAGSPDSQGVEGATLEKLYIDWAGIFEEDRAGLLESEAGQKKTINVIVANRLRIDQLQMEGVRSRNLAEAARSQEDELTRRAESAMHRAKEARRKGLPRGRWDAEQRHWSSEAQNFTRDKRRQEDEERRSDTQMKELVTENEELNASIEGSRSEAQVRGSRLASLERLSDSIVANATIGTPDELLAPSVSKPAVAVLGEMVEKIGNPMKAIRLAGRDRNTITLKFDYISRGDDIVMHERKPVFAVAAPVPPEMLGIELTVR